VAFLFLFRSVLSCSTIAIHNKKIPEPGSSIIFISRFFEDSPQPLFTNIVIAVKGYQTEIL